MRVWAFRRVAVFCIINSIFCSCLLFISILRVEYVTRVFWSFCCGCIATSVMLFLICIFCSCVLTRGGTCTQRLPGSSRVLHYLALPGPGRILLQGSQLSWNSWNSWNFKSVLKLSWNFTHLARNWLLMCNNMLQFSVLFATTSHYYLDIVDVDCPIVLLTVLWLYYSILMFMNDFCWRKTYAFTLFI